MVPVAFFNFKPAFRILAASSLLLSLAACGQGNYGGGSIEVGPTTVTVVSSGAGVSLSTTSGLVTTEAGGTSSFTVTLNSEPSSNVVITLTTGNASEILLRGGDSPVTPVSVIALTFTNANWNTPQTVTLVGQDDGVNDGDVGVTITTSAASSSDPAYDGLAIANITATNLDDEPSLTPGISLSATSGLTTTEAGGTASFTVVLDSPPTANVTIAISSGNTAEILVRGGSSPVTPVASITLTFTSANWNTAQTVTLIGQDDLLSDGNIITTIDTAPAVSADPDYNGLNAANVTATNIDDDTVGVSVSPMSGLITTEAGGTATFTVVLNTAPNNTVVILVVSGNTSEITTSTGSLTFTPANWSTPQTVTLTGVNDVIVDGPKAVTIALFADGILTTDTTGYKTYNPPDVSATNMDDDATGFSVFPVSGLSTSESGGSDSFSVSLATPPNGNVVVNVVSSNTSEVTVNKSTLTFTTGNWASPQTVVVTGVDDALSDGNQTVAILLTVNVGLTTDTTGYAALDPADPLVTNSDDDAAGVTVNPTTGLTTNESGQSTTFSVKLNTVPNGNVVIAINNPDTTEVSIDKTSLTFTPANWATPQVVTITGVNDAETDGPIGVVLGLTINGGSTTDTTGYASLDPDDVTVTNLDNEAEAQGSPSDPVSLIGALPFHGSVGSGYSYYKIAGLTPSASHYISLSNLSANLTLGVFGTTAFTPALCTSAKWPDSRPESCFANSTASGELYFRVDGTVSGGTGSAFIINVIAAPSNEGSAATPVDITGLVPYSGVVGTNNGNSYYKITGLTPSSTRFVAATNLTEDVNLYVYSDTGFSSSLCSSAASTIAESCVATVPASGNLYIRVQEAGGLTGATFTVRVQAPPVAEGTVASPIDLTGLLPYSGVMANPGSFYVIGGLIPGMVYRVKTYDNTNNPSMFVYTDAAFTAQTCSSAQAVNLPESCLATANGSGKLYIKNTQVGGPTTYQIDIE